MGGAVPDIAMCETSKPLFVRMLKPHPASNAMFDTRAPALSTQSGDESERA